MSISNKKVGILGGGQLAQMIVRSAQKMGVEVSVYSESKEDPAALVCPAHTKAKFTNSKALKAWIQKQDAVGFESEFFDLSKIKSKKFSPSLENMSLIRDRLSQKSLLELYKIPTSNFSIAHKDLKFNGPVVFKQRLFGYDGYGTKICKDKKNFDLFLSKEQKNLNNWIVEDFIPFKRELAFSMARNKKNQFCILPLVESFQKDAKCFWIKGPVDSKKTKPLITKVKKMLTSLDYVGLMAFELFETKTGELLINEVAPRVHNSAHYSIEALSPSQFDLQVLCLLNLDLPKTPKLNSAFSMINLIGKSSKAPKLSNPSQGNLHWYGKSKNRLGRKMGHMTFLDETPNKALKLALKEEKRQSL